MGSGAAPEGLAMTRTCNWPLLTIAGAALLSAALLATRPARAGNVDLTTLPPRASCQLTIYNSEDLTLARETRRITFKRGVNKIQFSWTNTLIDPTSLEFRVKERNDELQLVDATFPGSRPEVVIWSVESQVEGEIECEVSYFTSGLSWAMDYTGIADPQEKTVRFDGYVTVANRSGEDYEGADVRLVVGVVNLVEKITLLAQRRGIPVPKPQEPEYKKMKEEAMNEAMDAAGAARAPRGGEDMEQRAERAVVKEGLSEYFLFSIEGQEDVPNGWEKRMRAVKTEKPVPIDIVYRVRDYQYGPEPVRFLLWKNDKEHGLGESPLPDGTIRLFRENGPRAAVHSEDGLAFLGAQQIRYVPAKQDVEVNVGPDEEVILDVKSVGLKRSDFVFQRDGDRNEYVSGWKETAEVRERVRNFRDRTVKFEIRRRFSGDVELVSDAAPRADDAFTVEFLAEIPAHGQKEVKYTLVRKEGESAKQNRVLVK